MINVSFDLSKVPCEWLVVRSGNFFTPKSIKNTEGEFNLSVYRDYGVILKDSREDNHNRVSEDTSNYKLVEPGDFVLNKMKCFQGSLGVSEYRGIVSPSYTVLKPKKPIHNKYFHYLLRSELYRQMYAALSYGVRIGQWELHFHDFKEIPSLCPQIEEQELISRYLDKKIGQIDSLVDKIKKKIELLKEQRNSLINHYVTKGVDPSVEMKGSGVEWIGDIPKHWTVISVKRLFTIYFGGSWGDEPTDNQIDHIVKVVRVTEFDMNNLKVINEIPTLRSLELSRNSYKLLKNGDLILEKSGGGEKTPVGRIVLYHKTSDDMVINSNFTNVCRPNMEVVDPYFCVFLLSSLYYGGVTVRNIKQTTGIQNLDLDGFMSEKVSIPSLEEQVKISSRIIDSNYFIQNLVQKNLDKINLLKEYRQSLISSVVTGKVRVTEKMI